MIGPEDPNQGPGRGPSPEDPGPGRFWLWIPQQLVPKANRDQFIGDLLEEYEIIPKEKGLAEARRWFRGQVLRSISQCFQWRVERAIRLLWSKGFLARVVVVIALFAYLLPAVLIGTMLCGVAIVIRFLVDLMRRPHLPDTQGPGADPPHPPDPQGPGWFLLWIIWIIALIVPKSYRDDFVRNLREEFEIIRREQGLTEARTWLRRQVLRSIPWCLQWRVERAIRFLQSGKFLPTVVQIALCLYLLPALLAVVLVSLVGIVILFLVNAPRRFPPPTKGRKLLNWVRSNLCKVVDIVKKFFHRGGDQYWASWFERLSGARACGRLPQGYSQGSFFGRKSRPA
jgi:hypothetical protein